MPGVMSTLLRCFSVICVDSFYLTRVMVTSLQQWNSRSTKMRNKVLVAFQHSIGAFLTPQERWTLARASKWLRTCYETPRDAPKRTAAGLFFLSSSPDEFAVKVAELHASLVRSSRNAQHDGGSSRNSNKSKRRQRGSLMINAVKLGVVMRDLVLVAMGIRASCLVDCCALEQTFVALLLETLTEQASTFGGTFSHVYAVILQGNVFFVHAQRFLQQKCVDVASALHNMVVVNVSTHLQQPQVIIPAPTYSGSQPTRARDILQVVETICEQLIALVVVAQRGTIASSSKNRILELKETRISTTALAGVLLCYPVIYDLYDPSDVHLASGGHGDGSGWEVQENCLSMCPLFVLQTSIVYVCVWLALLSMCL